MGHPFRSTAVALCSSLLVAGMAAEPAQSPTDTPESSDTTTTTADRVGFIGLSIGPAAEPDAIGLPVGAVTAGGPAARAGIQAGDVLHRFDDQWLVTPEQFAILIRRAGEGASAELLLDRDGERQTVTVTLAGADRDFLALQRDEETRSAERAPGTWFDLPDGLGGFDQMPGFFQDRAGEIDWQGWRERLHEQMRQLREQAARGVRGGSGLLDDLGDRLAPAEGTGFVLRYRDESGATEITSTAEGHRARVTDADGTVLYEGPVNTPEQRAKLPETARQHLDRAAPLTIDPDRID